MNPSKNQNNKLSKNENNILLSILILSVKGRESFLRRLLKCLQDQILKDSLQNNVEIIIFKDNFKYTIGYKRNELMREACGKFLVFIDDDDLVAENYCKEILNIIQNKPSIDYIGHKYKVYINGDKINNTYSSLKAKKWENRNNNMMIRHISHINPIKSSIAKQFLFEDINQGEDILWANNIYQSGLIKKEHFINEELYIYLYNMNSSISNDKLYNKFYTLKFEKFQQKIQIKKSKNSVNLDLNKKNNFRKLIYKINKIHPSKINRNINKNLGLLGIYIKKKSPIIYYYLIRLKLYLIKIKQLFNPKYFRQTIYSIKTLLFDMNLRYNFIKKHKEQIKRLDVSALIPTYNDDYTLFFCLKSICPFVKEVIVVNDGSNDKTEELVKKLRKNFPHIKYYKNKKNLGSIESRNLCLKYAKYDKVMFIDADDVFKGDYKSYMHLKRIIEDDVPIIFRLIELWGDFYHIGRSYPIYDGCHFYINRKQNKFVWYLEGDFPAITYAKQRLKYPLPLFFHLPSIKSNKRLYQWNYIHLKKQGLENNFDWKKFNDNQVVKNLLNDPLRPNLIQIKNKSILPKVLQKYPPRFKLVYKNNKIVGRKDYGWNLNEYLKV